MDMMTSAMEYTYKFELEQQDSKNHKVNQREFLDGYDLLDKDDWT